MNQVKNSVKELLHETIDLLNEDEANELLDVVRGSSRRMASRSRCGDWRKTRCLRSRAGRSNLTILNRFEPRVARRPRY
jgi:hypothetical protein